MGGLIECQIAIESWGKKARFRRAKVGLLRKGSSIYIAVFSKVNSICKFEIEQNTMELFPQAIRLTDLGKDIFIKDPSDDQRYKTMVRQISVILKRDKYRQGDRAGALDKLIARIPTYDGVKARDQAPAPLKARLDLREKCHTCDKISSIGDHYGCCRCLDTTGNETRGNHLNNGNGITNRINCDSHIPEQQPGRTYREYDQYEMASLRRFKQRLENEELRTIVIRGLDRLPRELWHRASLYELELSYCNLTIIPKQLATLSSNLTSLVLSNNKLAKLPRVFCCKMNNLRLLDLSHNQIETLPIEIKFFSRLVSLDISNNNLRMLPTTFSDLRSLTKLYVANNNLSQLPAFRKDEIRLKFLDVSNNPLDGALKGFNTFEVYPSYDASLGYEENLFCPLSSPMSKKKHFPSLFEISMLNIVRCDKLLKLASEESLPRSIVSTMQRDIFKCYKCSKMNILPAYNSTDFLDYVDQVEQLVSGSTFSRGMTFMKLLCRNCFDKMSS